MIYWNNGNRFNERLRVKDGKLPEWQRDGGLKIEWEYQMTKEFGKMSGILKLKSISKEIKVRLFNKM